MKKCWISFGDIDLKLIFPFSGAFIKLCLEFLMDKPQKEFKKHPIINGLNEALGYIFSFILLLIMKIRAKRKNNKNLTSEISQNKQNKILKKIEELKKAKRDFIILCCAMNILHKYLLYNIIHCDIINAWMIDVVALSTYSWFLLDIKLYIHQYISIFFMVVASAFLFPYKAEGLTFLKVFCFIFIELLHCINHTLIKYGMEYKYIIPYEMCFYEGCTFFIFNIILLLSFFKVEIPRNPSVLKVFKHVEYDNKIYIDNFDYFKSITKYEIFIFGLSSINRLLYHLSSLLTMKYFSPSHLLIILLSDEIYAAIKRDVKGDIDYIILTFIVFPIMYFSLLIFIEIIELNFWGLSENTRKNIRERSKFESKFLSDRNDSEDLDIGDGLFIELPPGKGEN